MTRQALIVRGGWEGHSPVEATDLFIPFLRDNDFEVRTEDSPQIYADDEVMAATDLVVQCVTMSSIEPEALTGLSRAITNGTGMAGWHGGIADSYRNSSDYLHMIGGQFACHPGRADDPTNTFADYRVEFTDLGHEHPITAGLDDFELTTEQYWVLADDYLDVLATTTLPVVPHGQWNRPVVSPAAWSRQWGAGRIAVITPGHDLATLNHPTVTTMVQRSMLWAAR